MSEHATLTDEKLNQGASVTGGPMQPIEVEVARGLTFAHLMALAVQRQNNETVRLVEALSERLAAQGVISAAEWAERRDQGAGSESE